MTKINDGGPAFPVHGGMPDDDPRNKIIGGGMSLRDYFAIHCDQPGAAEIVSAAGLTYSVNQVWTDEKTSIGTFNDWYGGLDPIERYALYARVRYALADAMIAQRDKEQ